MEQPHSQDGASAENRNTSSTATVPPAAPPPLPIVRCPHCFRTIDASDPFCRHCGKRQTPAESWYYNPVLILVLAFTVLGPFALYLVWKAPKLTRSVKLLMAVAILIYTIVLGYYSYRIGSLMTRHWMDFGRQMEELRLR